MQFPTRLPGFLVGLVVQGEQEEEPAERGPGCILRLLKSTFMVEEIDRLLAISGRQVEAEYVAATVAKYRDGLNRQQFGDPIGAAIPKAHSPAPGGKVGAEVGDALHAFSIESLQRRRQRPSEME